MTRKIIAFGLLLLMTVVVATSQSGLHYCLCNSTASFGSCECASEIQEVDSQAACDESSCPCPSEDGKAFQKSCGDCTIELSINVDEFVDMAVRDMTQKSVASDMPDMSAISESYLLPRPRSAYRDKIRGSPPPSVEYASAPLRVRYSVFLV